VLERAGGFWSEVIASERRDEMNDYGEDGKRSVLGWLPASLPPHQRVLGLFWAKWLIGAVRAFIVLGVPDILANGPRTAADISGLADADQDAMYRLLRALAAAGFLDETDDGVFALTRYGAGLVSGTEGGVGDMFLFASDPMLWRPYEDVAYAVRTGTSSFGHVFDMSFYKYVETNQAARDVFDRAMRQNRYPAVDRIFDKFNFGQFRRIADVGGGQGQFLAEVLRRHPAVTGVLADQPSALAEAKRVLEDGGVADRVTIVPTDFFTEVPSGCDAYFVKHTLHNWDDQRAELILRRIREAIGDDSKARLLIVDQLLRGPGEWDVGKLIDIESLTVLGGKERSQADWNRIAAAAGFMPANEPEPGELALLEYRPN
jgi:ubiquinone/menaquinone biosynthesis C-methylase UbiE